MKRALGMAAVALAASIAVLGWWSLRVRAGTDRAELDRRDLAVAPTMPTPRDGPRPLVLNGQRTLGRTIASPHGVDEVLAYVAAACRSSAPEDLLARLRDRAPLTEQARDEVPGLYASWTEGGGFASCLRTGDTGPSPDALVRFAETGDVSAFGGFTYVEASADGEGSHVTALWSDGAFAPGVALAPSSARSTVGLGSPRATLTAPDAGATVELHRVSGTLAEVRRTIASAARADGWTAATELPSDDHRVVRMRRGADELWVVLRESERHVAVSVVARRGVR